MEKISICSVVSCFSFHLPSHSYKLYNRFELLSKVTESSKSAIIVNVPEPLSIPSCVLNKALTPGHCIFDGVLTI